MKKLGRIASSIAVAAVFLSASPAVAQQPVPAYHTVYYSDASHQTHVGHIRWIGCNRWGQPVYRLGGTQSAYWTEELVGYCVGMNMEPA